MNVFTIGINLGKSVFHVVVLGPTRRLIVLASTGTAAVSNPNHAGYAVCQLHAAICGNYGIRVFMPAASTVGNRALIFQIARGILYQQNDPASNPNTFPTVSRDGRGYLPDPEAAFAKGVPFWIEDVSFTPSTSGSTGIRYTVYSNPSVTLGFDVTIFDVFESTEGKRDVPYDHLGHLQPLRVKQPTANLHWRLAGRRGACAGDRRSSLRGDWEQPPGLPAE